MAEEFEMYEVTVDMTVTRTFNVFAKSPAKARYIGKKWAEEAQLAGAQSGSMYVKSSTITGMTATARPRDKVKEVPE